VSLRVGVAGVQHETNTFAESRADFREFVQADAWPGLSLGNEVRIAVKGMNVPTAGMLNALRESPYEAVPLLWASASPSGPVTKDAFEALWWLFERALRASGPIDALLLELHGAMVTEHLASGDSEWLRRTRSVVSPSLPVVVVLDFHANISQDMVDLCDLILVYRTYPHVDAAACGAHAVEMMRPLVQGRRPAHALRRAPFLISLPWQSTLVQPMARLMAAAQAPSDGVWHVSLAAGFPLADVEDSAPAVVAYAQTQELADAAADRLMQAMVDARADFGGRLWSPEHAVLYARAHGRSGAPVVLADTQDNPGAGGSGDTTELLHALIRANANDVCVGLVFDPEFVAQAHAVGTGAVVDMPLGGKRPRSSSPPVPGPWNVQSLGNGRFPATGPFYAGCRMELGPMACVSRNGVRIVVASRRQQAADQAMFRHLGIEPREFAVLALKSSVHFRADFTAIAKEILVVEAEGANTADLHKLRFENCRRPPA
jgi:microcystin degradation protein MlrC